MVALSEKIKTILDSSKGSLLCKNSVQHFILGNLESIFSRHGARVANHPIRYIVFCLFVAAICGIGLLKFKKENNVIKLWISETSSQRSLKQNLIIINPLYKSSILKNIE